MDLIETVQENRKIQLVGHFRISICFSLLCKLSFDISKNWGGGSLFLANDCDVSKIEYRNQRNGNHLFLKSRLR